MRRIATTNPIVFFVLVALVLACMRSAHAKGMVLIRDAEIERNLKILIHPVLDVAGIDRNAFRLFIVQDESLNAFVAGGQNIFIHTGLLLRAENYSQVMGVMAHETGHIAGGHLVRRQQDLQAIAEQSWVLQLLAGAALALGRGDAGIAILGAGAQVFQRSALAYTRIQERSADQAGLTYLTQLGVSSQGLLDFFKILQGEQRLQLDGQPNPYLQSHPLTRERIEAVAAFLRSNPPTTGSNPEFATAFGRIRAKLGGFLLPPEKLFRLYPKADNSFPARYARAVNEFRFGDASVALRQMDGLIADYPKDPFLFELRGQIRLESPELSKNGRAQYLADYQQALALAPSAALIRLGLAQAWLADESASGARQALPYLTEVLRQEPNYGQAWRQEAIARGRVGEIGKSALALAELALLQGDKPRAKAQAQRALAALSNDAVARQRATDIQNQIAATEENKK